MIRGVPTVVRGSSERELERAMPACGSTHAERECARRGRRYRAVSGAAVAHCLNEGRSWIVGAEGARRGEDILQYADDIVSQTVGEDRPVRGPPAVADYLSPVVSTVDPLFGGVAVVEAARPHPSVKNVP